MSSIFGVWNRNNKPVNKDKIDEIEEKTSWWNPETIKHHVDKSIGIIHWSMLTTPNSTQETLPTRYESLGFTIVADTRIDNREYIETLLAVQNVNLLESELIIRLFVKFGEQCVKHLKGAFSFAIWDEKAERWFIARDQMGVKPLCYAWEQNRFSFATQKISLLCLPGFNKIIDWSNIMYRIVQLDTEKHSTEYKSIKVFPPAHFAWVTKDNFQLRRYWELDTSLRISYHTDQEYIDRFRELFEQAIRRRMVNLKTVGTHLSGGLDSSGITGVAQHIAVEEQGREIEPLAYVVPLELTENQIPWESENKYVLSQIEFSKISNPHLVEKPIFRTFWEKLTHETMVVDGIARTNNVSTEYEIQHKAREEGIDVILSGFGGDECVTSFVRPYYLEYLDKKQIGKFIKTAAKDQDVKLRAALVAMFIKLKRPLFGDSFDSLIFKNYENSKRKGKIKNEKAFLTELDKGIFDRSYVQSNKDLEEALNFEAGKYMNYKFPTSIQEYQRNHITRYHTNLRMESEILSAKYFGIDYRYPMMDIDLLQYVISCPLEQKIDLDQNIRRNLYRRSITKYSPDILSNRDNKIGHLKPMSYFYTKKVDNSLSQNIVRLLRSSHFDFVDREHLKSNYLPKKLPRNFTTLMRIANLIETDKMTY